MENLSQEENANVWLYSAKWSHLNKDKQDCRTFQQDISARKAICSQLETLEKKTIIYNYNL